MATLKAGDDAGYDAARFYMHDDLPSRVRLVLNMVSISCMVGKMCLALVAMFPLKEDLGDTGGVVTGGAHRVLGDIPLLQAR